ncbi:RNA polymerase sigma-70 factor (ECF subfamily) [Bradyrhizobium sp. R2.2-H]|jgi:RNA polymerase sigma-70 factor (ECF subfamily)|uniref:RNA polymerase sigma factor n=1 Tax=unclassified Bradyrhizobium TaxID=2631580 RepID=UPI00104E1AE6|nr:MULTISPECIES: RNA polymerase sigma factor [unclassified Bradyrhizobium]TCU59310.1 RNA polymerase sigma-70 factor (ECF subfamily) [Bradyrhizobium sp. Y-H1]TCU63682.1 RNA polymerase sigma-70 factor (ECF subfamily) [Bradyrhizobium sp. R2.2-H]
MSYAADVWAPVEAEIATTVPAQETVPMMPSAPLVPGGPPDVADVVYDEDSELLDRLATGDEVAFRMLVERHIDRAYAIALRIVGNTADAEDVVQDSMLKIWSHRGRWQHGRAKFSTWLYRVISNRCIDLRRKPRTENVEAVPEVADKQPGAVELIARNELNDALELAMQRLPEQQRIAVILSYHENMSNGEIAQVMDTTVAAVESLLKRGRQQLRQLLRKHERDIRTAFTDC